MLGSSYVKKYKDIADSVDAFVLSSPEYGTMSGVMKNLLDWLFNQTSGFGFISTMDNQILLL